MKNLAPSVFSDAKRLSKKGSDPLPSHVHLVHCVEKRRDLTPFRTASNNPLF